MGSFVAAAIAILLVSLALDIGRAKSLAGKAPRNVPNSQPVTPGVPSGFGEICGNEVDRGLGCRWGTMNKSDSAVSGHRDRGFDRS